MCNMGKINVYDTVLTENHKNMSIGQNFFYINLHLIDGLGMGFTACKIELMPEGALTSFTACDAYRNVVGQT